MVWHIFKKDWKLLWIFVIAVASLQAIAEFTYFRLGLFGEDPLLEMLSEVVPMLAMLGSWFLIVAIVHLDRIPGVRQDWLVRPVRRRDLLVEKFLFLIVAVEGPIFAVNLLQGLANGFPLRASLVAAASRVVFLLFFVVLPFFILASVTQNMTEAFIFGCGCTVIILAFFILAAYLDGSARGTLMSVTHSGIGWIGEVFRFGLVAVASVVILGIQYFRRHTITARGLVVVFGLLLLTSVFLPWTPAFAVEKRLSPRPAAGASTTLAFAPRIGKYRSPSGAAVSSEASRRLGGRDYTDLFLPVEVAGLPNDSVLIADRTEFRFIAANGTVRYHGAGDGLEDDQAGSDFGHQRFSLETSVYSRIPDETLRVEINYSLTLFGLTKSYAIAALGGNERMPGWGWCRTKVNEAGTSIELRCMQLGHAPICGMVFLENASTGARNPVRSACQSDYTPFGDQAIPDNVARFGANIPFRDPSGLAKFPVDGAQLPRSRVVIRVYEPEDHFTRSLLIPQMRLKDWLAQ
jgi:hypothetical protein